MGKSRRRTGLLVVASFVWAPHYCGIWFVSIFVWVILVAAILKRMRGGVAVQMIQLA